MLSKKFCHVFWLLYRNIFPEHFFSEYLLLDTCFTVSYVFDELDQKVLNISNFISIHSQVFSRIDVH